MRRFALLFFLFIFIQAFFIQALAADVSGRWTGTIAVRDEASGAIITTPVEIQFTQRDSAISGKIGRAKDADGVPIRNARIEGNRLYFEASSEETSGPCKFSLLIAGDSMEGDMTGAIDSEDITGKVKVTRLKQ
jgi:hypothetical protein